jgi:hypothetical protein
MNPFKQFGGTPWMGNQPISKIRNILILNVKIREVVQAMKTHPVLHQEPRCESG